MENSCISAGRTIVLSRHGSNLARPVIIHGHVPSTPYCEFFGVSSDGNCAYVHWGSFTSNSKLVRRAIWFTWFSEPHDSVYGTWHLQAVTHPLINRARRRLTSVIEQISMRERRIPPCQGWSHLDNADIELPWWLAPFRIWWGALLRFMSRLLYPARKCMNIINSSITCKDYCIY